MPFTITPVFSSENLAHIFHDFCYDNNGFELECFENADGNFDGTHHFQPTAQDLQFLAGLTDEIEEEDRYISAPTMKAFVEEFIKPFFQNVAFQDRIKDALQLNAIPSVEDIDFSALY